MASTDHRGARRPCKPLKSCGEFSQSYSDFVMLAAMLAARSSEVSRLHVGEVDFGKNLVVIRQRVFPGKGGLVTKPTKSRKERRVPILEPLRPRTETPCMAEGSLRRWGGAGALARSK